MKSVTNKDELAWLLNKLPTDSFGLGEEIQFIVVENPTKKETHILHPAASKLHSKANRVLCGNTESLKILNPEKQKYVTVRFNATKNLCLPCHRELAAAIHIPYGPDFYIYDEIITDIARTCYLIEKLLQTPPEKYSSDWYTLITLKADLHYLQNSNFEESENILSNSLKETEKQLTNYFFKNPCFLTDEVIKKIFTRYCDTWLDANNQTKTNALVGEKTLLKLENNTSTKSYKKCLLHIYMLQPTVQNITHKGVLIPTKLLKALIKDKAISKSTDYDPVSTAKNTDTLKKKPITGFPFEILGTVKDTDTLEILETALGLETPIEKALQAARLLAK